MRHELKYYATESQLIYLESVLKTIMGTDPNQGENGYTIRSLYFDNEDDKYMNESINGVNNRVKYRIRIYNGSDSVINLEKKITINNLKSKSSSKLSRITAEDIIEREGISLLGSDVLKEVVFLRKSENLKPKCIIEYDRFAFVSDIGNVRITFDRNIRVSARINEFFERPIMLPALENGVHILEVKYDGILPGHIAKFINMLNVERTSVSKYVLCRQYLEDNSNSI